MNKNLPWFPFGFGAVTANRRLLCLPFAGGGATFFMPWRKALSAVGVVPVQYPGRETRMSEPFYQDMGKLVDDLAQALLPHLDRPYSILGYSLGAKIGFALCHRLQQMGAPMPEVFIPAAHGAPHVPLDNPGAADLPDAEFCNIIRQYGGMPEMVFQDPELTNMMLPILRADMRLVGHAVPGETLPCPMIAYAGTEDAAAIPANVAQWERYAGNGFLMRTFQGGHFFARTDEKFLSTLAIDIIPSPHGGRAIFS